MLLGAGCRGAVPAFPRESQNDAAEGREPWKGAGVCGELLEGTGQGDARQATDNATLPQGQGGAEVWVPNSLRDAEDSGKAQRPPAGERGERGRGPGRAGWQRVAPAASALRPARRESRRGGEGVSRSPRSRALISSPQTSIGRAPARARGTRIGWPRLALSGGFPAAAVSMCPCAADRVTAPSQSPGHALFSRCATVDVGVRSRALRLPGRAGPRQRLRRGRGRKSARG